jgi:hypothetical protein
MTEELRIHIRGCQLSLNELSRRTKVATSQLSRFMRGRPISSKTADRLCLALGLTLNSGRGRRASDAGGGYSTNADGNVTPSQMTTQS